MPCGVAVIFLLDQVFLESVFPSLISKFSVILILRLVFFPTFSSSMLVDKSLTISCRHERLLGGYLITRAVA